VISISILHPDFMDCTRDVQKVGHYGQARKMYPLSCGIQFIMIAVYGAMIQLAGFIPDMLESNHVSCAFLTAKKRAIYLAKHMRSLLAGTASEVISESFKYKATALEESKKRKRDALGGQVQSQSIRKLSTSSPSQNRTDPESPRDARPCLHSPMSKMPYSQPALEITPGPHSSTTSPIIQSMWNCLISRNFSILACVF
jgi:hypothetical protein